jgi:hypothetical protein
MLLLSQPRRRLSASRHDYSMTVDIDANLAAFLQHRTPEARYASFDYCFNYFQEARESGDTAQLADGEHRMLSCLQLGFFLASWGMMRGSGDLTSAVFGICCPWWR